MLLALLILLLPEKPFDFFRDDKVENDDKAEKPPEIPQPDYPRYIEQSPETELCPFVMGKFLPVHNSLLVAYRLDDSLESLRIIHSEVSKDLTVKTDILLCQLAHELRISDTVLTCGSIDSLDPESAEIALVGLAVTISIGETFLVGVLGYGPDVLP